MTDILDRSMGCILGGATGDAVGAPVEFDQSPQIDDMLSWRGRPAGSWTDDTEMTIATAEAIIAAGNTDMSLSVALWNAYRAWRRTHDPGRAPGATCLSATARSEPGTVEAPINDSKGCGGVMRVSPVGIAFANRESAYVTAIEAAAMTHGHRMGYITAGLLAAWISGLIEGDHLTDAYDVAISLTHARHPDFGVELTDRLTEAKHLAGVARDDRVAIEGLGEGWTGDEALAIAAYCAFKYPAEPGTAILAAANHRGDSDSTASICGQVVGASGGLKSIPARWHQALEDRDRLVSLAQALARLRTGR